MQRQIQNGNQGKHLPLISFTLLQRLKASFHYSVGKICEERGKELGLDVDKKVIDWITNLGIQQLETLSNDLEAFAK